MRTYTGYTSVAQAALGKYADLGFWIDQSEDHVVKLYFKDLLLGIFIQTTVTVEMLRSYCKDHLRGMEGR